MRTFVTSSERKGECAKTWRQTGAGSVLGPADGKHGGHGGGAVGVIVGVELCLLKERC